MFLSHQMFTSFQFVLFFILPSSSCSAAFEIKERTCGEKHPPNARALAPIKSATKIQSEYRRTIATSFIYVHCAMHTCIQFKLLPLPDVLDKVLQPHLHFLKLALNFNFGTVFSHTQTQTCLHVELH